MLATVVDNVGAPEPANAVAGAVFPIINKILRDERKQNNREAHAQIKQPELPKEHQDAQADEAERDICYQIAQPHRHRCDGVTPFITTLRRTAPYENPFQCHRDDKKRRGPHKDVRKCELSFHMR